MTSTTTKRYRSLTSEVPTIGQRKIRFPPRAPKPTFTTQELSTLPQLRGTLSAWYKEFREDGPHEEDIAAMERYLVKVVLEERDLGKVVGVVRWIAWLIEDDDVYDENGSTRKGKEGWVKALEGIKEKVQVAVKERGLGRLEL
jgi:DNA repair protein REV1